MLYKNLRDWHCVVCRVWGCSIHLTVVFWNAALKKSKLQWRRRGKLWTRWRNRKKNKEEKTRNSAGTDLYQQGETNYEGAGGKLDPEPSWENRYEHYNLSLSIVFCWNNKSEQQFSSGCLFWCLWRTNQQHSVLFKSGRVLCLRSMFPASKFGTYFSRNVWRTFFLKSNYHSWKWKHWMGLFSMRKIKTKQLN